MIERRHHTVGTLTETVHELIAPRRHRQPYRAGWQRPNRTGAVIRDHVTDHESLIVQLRAAITDRAETAAGMKAGQAPRTTLPRFSVDAFDRMERIRTEVAEWCGRVGVPSQSAKNARLITTYLDVIERVVDSSRAATVDTGRAITALREVATFIATAVEPDLGRLVDASAELGQDDLGELVDAADRWRTWCRIMTGWQDAALRPDVPCPDCGAIAGERAGLKDPDRGCQRDGRDQGRRSSPGRGVPELQPDVGRRALWPPRRAVAGHRRLRCRVTGLPTVRAWCTLGALRPMSPAWGHCYHGSVTMDRAANRYHKAMTRPRSRDRCRYCDHDVRHQHVQLSNPAEPVWCAGCHADGTVCGAATLLAARQVERQNRPDRAMRVIVLSIAAGIATGITVGYLGSMLADRIMR